MEILLGGEGRSKVIEIQDGWGGGGGVWIQVFFEDHFNLM